MLLNHGTEEGTGEFMHTLCYKYHCLWYEGNGGEEIQYIQYLTVYIKLSKYVTFICIHNNKNAVYNN